ncbi:MAG: DUF222 domain-containing protein [Acidimicrobiales bacterium]
MVEEAEAAALEGEIAELCGVLNAITGRLVDRIARVLAIGSWEGAGIRSPEQWVSWKCGVSPARARSLVAMARRLAELPQTRTGLETGELSEDQVAVVVRHAPAHIAAQVSELARAATVTQLRRVLGSYPLRDGQPGEEVRRVSFGHTDEGHWRLSALLPADEGALWERALAEARDTLFRAADAKDKAAVSWADALVAVADRSLGAGAVDRPYRDRHLVLLHVEAGDEGDTRGHLHLGPAVSPGLRRFLSCDSRIRPVLGRGGQAVSVGRALRTVPERTRVVIEERDRGCRVPGCDRSRWLHIHHLRHWEDGGTTDTENLLALCAHHHRLHHRGGLGMAGNADDPDGVAFTDERGRPLAPCGRPAPPKRSLAAAVRELDLPLAVAG